MNAVPGARTQTTLPLSPPQSNMAPPSEDNGKVKKDIIRLPWRCAHHIRVIYTVNGMLLCLGYGCSSASPPPFNSGYVCLRSRTHTYVRKTTPNSYYDICICICNLTV